MNPLKILGDMTREIHGEFQIKTMVEFLKESLE